MICGLPVTPFKGNACRRSPLLRLGKCRTSEAQKLDWSAVPLRQFVRRCLNAWVVSAPRAYQNDGSRGPAEDQPVKAAQRSFDPLRKLRDKRIMRVPPLRCPSWNKQRSYRIRNAFLWLRRRRVVSACNQLAYSISSVPGGRLCLGFLRCFFGTISLGEGTAPMRSRASRRISVGTSYPFGFCFFATMCVLLVLPLRCQDALDQSRFDVGSARYQNEHNRDTLPKRWPHRNWDRTKPVDPHKTTPAKRQLHPFTGCCAAKFDSSSRSPFAGVLFPTDLFILYPCMRLTSLLIFR